MLKLFLVIAISSSGLLHAGIGLGLKGQIAQFSSALNRKLSRYLTLPALKGMVEVEVSLPAIQVMESFDVGFEIGDEREVSTKLLIELMVHEYKLRMLALTEGVHSKMGKLTATNICCLFDKKSVVGLDLRLSPNISAVLNDSSALLKHYGAKLAEHRHALDEALPAPESPKEVWTIRAAGKVWLNDMDEVAKSYADIILHQHSQDRRWREIKRGWNRWALMQKKEEY